MSAAVETPIRDIRVVVVDDSPAFQAVAREVIEATAGFVAVGVASTAEEALRVLERCAPDLVLMDVRLPGTDGVAAAQAFRRLPNPPSVMLLSADEFPDIAADPGAHGAMAFVPKQSFGPRRLRLLAQQYTGGPPALS